MDSVSQQKSSLDPLFLCVNSGSRLLASGLALSDGGIFKGFDFFFGTRKPFSSAHIHQVDGEQHAITNPCSLRLLYVSYFPRSRCSTEGQISSAI